MKKRSIGNVQHLGDNKYRLRVSAGYDDFGKRIQVSKVVEARTATEAERQLLNLYRERMKKASSSRDDTDPKTLGELYEFWMENHVKKNLEARTIEYYQDHWERYLIDKRNTKIANIRPALIVKIVNGVEAGDRTKQGVYAMLRTILRRSKSWGLISENPCAELTPPHYESEERDVYSEDELRTVISALADVPVKYQLIVWLAAVRGLRRQEIAGLNWLKGDIDFTRKTLKIQRAVVRVKKVGLVVKETKSKKSIRTLYLSEDLERMFSLHKQEQEAEAELLGDKWANEGWVFTGPFGKPINPDRISTWWSNFVENLDVKKIRFHDLRHTAASLMLSNSADILSVASALGHSRKSTTLDIYGHVLEDRKIKSLQILDDVVTKAPSAKSNL